MVVGGGVALLAGLSASLLTDTMIAEMTCVGSLTILVLGLNIMGVTYFRIADCLPALIFTPFVTALLTILGIG